MKHIRLLSLTLSFHLTANRQPQAHVLSIHIKSETSTVHHSAENAVQVPKSQSASNTGKKSEYAMILLGSLGIVQ